MAQNRFMTLCRCNSSEAGSESGCESTRDSSTAAPSTAAVDQPLGGEGTFVPISRRSAVARRGTGVVQRREVFVLEPGAVLAEGFALRGALLGRGGENFKAIREETGVRVWLAGEGVGRGAGGPEEQGPVRIVLDGRSPDDLARAVELTEDLAKTIREKHDAYQQRTRRNCRGKGDGSGSAKGKGKRTGFGGQDAEAFQQHIREEKEKLGRQIEEVKEKAAERRQEEAASWQELKDAEEKARDSMPAELITEEMRATRKAAAAGCVKSATEFWEALERCRAESQQPSALEARLELRRLRCALSESMLTSHKEARQLEKQATQLEKQAATLRSTGVFAALPRGAGRCCALFANGSCPFEGGKCPRGSHQEPEKPEETEVFRRITKAKLRLVQQKWTDAGGRAELCGAWQVRNPRLEFLFRGAEANFTDLYQQAPDVIDAWHGSAEENLVSIAQNGFDPRRRSGQVFGAGEYFAKDPCVSVGYCRGGSFMFLCKLLLGKPEVDHTWASGPKYYVIKQREGRMQVLPLFLVQFRPAERSGFLRRLLGELALGRDSEEPGALAGQQRGGLFACEARRDAGMTAGSTRHLWLGWLAPCLRFQNDDEVAADVTAFLDGHRVLQVVPERNGARIGAFVLLEEGISRATFRELSRRKYRGRWAISVDDVQPGNPKCAGKLCPRLTGPSRYCRGWNIRGHAAWQWGCPYAHPEEARPTYGVEPSLEAVPFGSAKFDDIATELQRSIPRAKIVRIQRSLNPALERMYEERRAFIQDKQGFAVEKELWHGTSVDAIPTLLKHGLQPPADSCPSAECPVSGGKGLCTTLCSTECKHCTQGHCWGKCHMYGLGVYLADIAQKSHQYVRKSGSTYSMLWCRVCLGNPYLIEGNLLSGQAMHDLCWCQDPSDFLEKISEDWSVSKGHDCYYVKGQDGRQKHGLGVHNSEYIVFQPYQILPLYRVDYKI